jgi:PadR family transcriptional regulator PadR
VPCTAGFLEEVATESAEYVAQHRNQEKVEQFIPCYPRIPRIPWQTADQSPPTHTTRSRTNAQPRDQQDYMPQPPNNDRLQGTLDLLVLKTLLRGPMHGWSVALRIQEVSREALQINQGSLYPALHRLEDAGYVRSEWGTSENNRRAKYYQLTALGKKQLAVETESWTRFTDAVGLVLRYA